MQTVAAKTYFRANLRTALDAADVSQRALALRTETAYTYVNRVLQGHQTPSIERAEEFAAALGYKLADLLVPPDEFEPHESVAAR